jgi:hypothetical protein
MELEETLLYWFTKNGTRRNQFFGVHKKMELEETLIYGPTQRKLEETLLYGPTNNETTINSFIWATTN